MTESHPDNSNQRKRKSEDADEVGLYSHHSVTKCALYSYEVTKPNTPFLPLSLAEANSGKAARPVRIYANGNFDIFHIGHMNALRQAKNAFPNVYLIVGVYSDKLAHCKNGFTVCTQEERYEALIHCRYVDEVVIDAPWIVTPEFMEDYQIDFVAIDDFKSGTSKDIYEDIKAMGRFIVTQPTANISTSEIIAKVTRNYDVYVRRNLLRGYSMKDLNVGFVKQKYLEIEDAIDQFHDAVKNIENQSQQVLQIIEGRSYEFMKRLADISENCLQAWNERSFNSDVNQLKIFEHNDDKEK